jgi:hypothetical protein
LRRLCHSIYAAAETVEAHRHRLFRDQLFFEKNALVIGRVIEASIFLIPEFLIKLRRLERKRIEPGRMASQHSRAALGLGHQAAANPAPAQIGGNP